MSPVSADGRGIEEVLDRLDRVLPVGAPALWESLRPPVRAADLDTLRRAVEPYDLPREVVVMLRWADGQDERGWQRWWPSISCGPLVSAVGAAEHYQFLRKETEDWRWAPLWLPVAHDGWDQAGVEMTADRPGAVIDASFGNAGVSVVAPSLAAMLDAVGDMLDAGMPPEQPNDHDELRRRAALINARDDWATWPYGRDIAEEVAAWPPEWRVSIGLPAEPDAPRLPVTPIREILRGSRSGAEPTTIEGYVTGRALVDRIASGNSIITLDDGTGATHLLIQSDTPGHYWAAWVGRRIQVDVLTGDAAERAVDTVLEAEPDRRARAPAGPCLLATAARVGVQSTR